MSGRVLAGRVRYAIPSLATLAGLTLGLAAVRDAAIGRPVDAAWLILWAMLADQLDGALARLLDARSRIGAELDSFSDFVAFGLAPAFLLLGGGPAPGGPAWLAQAALGVAYVWGCALRLARFNAHDVAAGGATFRGLPSTLAGSLVAALVLTVAAHGVALEGMVPGVILGVLGVLMVADPLRPPKIHVLMARAAARGRLGAGLAILALIAVYVAVALRSAPEYILGLAVLYGGVGSVLGRRPGWGAPGWSAPPARAKGVAATS
jgi:CDP-diacylglycerol--serine O-phosphatidyltransferase